MIRKQSSLETGGTGNESPDRKSVREIEEEQKNDQN